MPRSFYSKPVVALAKDLLGKYLVRKTSEGNIVAKIVEVEAYGGTDDRASHAYRGMTERNRVMFGKPSMLYVYFIYGNHYCINVKAEQENIPGAVLIRAVEIVHGEEIAFKNRSVSSSVCLANGPGKLTEALGINKVHNGIDLTESKEIYICASLETDLMEIIATRRIGIRAGTEKQWRFHIKSSRFVSGI